MLNRFLGFVSGLIILATLPGLSSGQKSRELPVNLIAHRGGIVDENRAENSRPAIEEAIRRGYWMLEVDLRQTRDGRIIVHHDRTFQKYFNDPRSVSDMEWDEAKKLRSELDGHRPLLFEEVAEMAQDNIKLMLDIKGGNFDHSSYQKIEQVLEKHNLLSSTFILSDADAQHYFNGKASLSRGLDEILQATEADEDVGKLYHVFELGGDLNQQMIQKANELGVKVVAAINVFRYQQPGLSDEEEWGNARKDIQRLMDLGIEYFQVDSVYEPLFRAE